MALAGAGAATSMAGCSLLGGESNSGEVHVITDQSNDQWQDTWQNTIIPEYKEEYGNDLNIEYAGLAGEALQRLSRLMQAGNPPDSFIYGFEGAITELYQRGQLKSNEEVLNEIEEEFGDPIPPLFSDPDGNRYMVPAGTYIIAINYREDFHDTLGLSVPTTWDELLENSKAISESDEIDAQGCAVPTGINVYTANWFWQFLRTNGGSRFGWDNRDENTIEVTFPREEVIETLEFMEELSQYSPDPESVGYSSAIDLYTSGRIGYKLFLNAWSIGISQAVDPNIANNSNVTAIPTNDIPYEELNLLTSCTNSDGYFVFNGGTNPEGAQDLFRYMYADDTQRMVDLNTIEPMRFLPGFEGVLELDAYREAEIFQENPHLLEVNDKLANDVLSKYQGPEEDRRPATAVTEYARATDSTVPRMVNEYIVQGKDADTVYENARDEIVQKVEEGRNIG
jgi:multiple sugar transport system substrate-binding protein